MTAIPVVSMAVSVADINNPASSTPLSAPITTASSGDLTVVAAVAGQSIRIYAVILMVAGTTSITMKDGASTSLSGAMPMTATNAQLVLPYDAISWFKTTAGNAFIINNSAAVQISGTVYYTQS